MTELTEQFLRTELETKSIRQIADELNTYPNKIARTARKLGIELPDRSEGQKRSYQTGRAIPPMAGKTHDSTTKDKISQTRHESWNNQKNAPDYDDLRDTYRKAYHKKSTEEKEEMQKLAARAVYDTRKTGSKLERFILEKLRDEGYKPQFHAQQVVSQEDLEVDIYLPELSVALEIDGVTHDENIYGQDHLDRRRAADSRKNGLLMTNGFTVIRIPNKVKHVSNYFLNSTWSAVKVELDRIEKEKPEPSVIYLENN